MNNENILAIVDRLYIKYCIFVFNIAGIKKIFFPKMKCFLYNEILSKYEQFIEYFFCFNTLKIKCHGTCLYIINNLIDE